MSSSRKIEKFLKARPKYEGRRIILTWKRKKPTSLRKIPGVKSHVVSTEKITINFLTEAPNCQSAIHHHESEQIMIVTGGACDMTVDGKLYHLEEGDVIILPSNLEHGTYVSDRGLRAIDIFSPPRQDIVAKLEAVKKSLRT